jgi:HK97 family phage portal protein
MFLSGIKAEDRSPWGHFWFEPVGVRTGSGVRVTADTALTLSAVFRTVSLVSGHLALLPIRFYKKGTRQQIVNHPVLNLLNKRPNRWQNAFEWREMMQGHIELRGNAYNEIYANGRGEIEELIPRHPDKVKIKVLDNGDYNYLITNPDGTTRTVSRGSIWHIRGLSSDGIVGLAVLEYARESFSLGIAAKSYGARFFANDAKPTGGWIEYPGTYRDKTQKQAIRETLQEAQSGMNRGKLMMLDYGMKYHEVGPTNEDMQFLGTQQHSVDDIARWFGIPPHKIGSLERSTNNNIEQQSLEYVTDALMTRASRNVAAIKADLLFDEEEFDVEYDFSEFLRGDSTALSNFITKMTNGGILTRNEGRAMVGKDPLPGLDTPLLPLNMVEEPGNDEPDGDDKAQKPVKQTASNDAEALQSIRNASAARLARRAAGALEKKNVTEVFDTDFAELIAESMAVPVESAKNWCDSMQSLKGLDESQIRSALISEFNLEVTI